MMFSVSRSGLILVFVMISSVGTILAACSSDSQQVDRNDSLHSRIAQMEKRVGFKILVPSYLPRNITDPPVILDTSFYWMETGNEKGVELTYSAGENGAEGIIIINQWNFRFGPPNPNLNEQFTALFVDDVKVVQRKHTLGIIGGGDSVDHEGWLFWWTQDGIYYETGIYHYPYDEAIKVIESMIRQGITMP